MTATIFFPEVLDIGEDSDRWCVQGQHLDEKSARLAVAAHLYDQLWRRRDPESDSDSTVVPDLAEYGELWSSVVTHRTGTWKSLLHPEIGEHEDEFLEMPQGMPWTFVTL